MHSQTRGERRELLYIATGNPEGHRNRQGRATRARGTSKKSWRTHLSHQKEVENHLVILLLRSDMKSYVSICPSIHLTTEFSTDTAQTPPPARYHPYFQVSPLFPPLTVGFSLSSCLSAPLLPITTARERLPAGAAAEPAFPWDHIMLITGGQTKLNWGPLVLPSELHHR